MLLFIGRSSAVWTVPLCCFNTSHVTLYPHSRCCTRCCDSRFNTSHVTLYLHVLQPLRLFLPFQYISCYSLSDVTFTTMSDKVKFQYISCYSLSAYQIFEYSDRRCFNTSHVTLYLYDMSILALRQLFQYISCYSLSTKTESEGIDTDMFQYISCYSLSLTRPCFFAAFSSFNTSHVTLYPDCGRTASVYHLVSIHLMLLFIDEA